jgi:hypothetical protein
MGLVFKKGVVAKLPGGMKISQYEVSNTGASGATINAKDIGLSTIFTLNAMPEQLDAAPTAEFTVGIGTFTSGRGDANYATLRAHAISPSASGTVNIGTFQVVATGI